MEQTIETVCLIFLKTETISKSNHSALGVMQAVKF